MITHSSEFLTLEESIKLSSFERRFNKINIRLLSKLRSAKFKAMCKNDFGPGTVGYNPTKDCLYMPYTLPSISHEVAHMLEMRDLSRLTKLDFGFKLFTERPSTEQCFIAAAREIRTFAIQDIINGRTNRFFIENDLCERFLIADLPYKKFKSHDDVLIWQMELFERTTKEWSIDRIDFEWDKRVDFIHNWMELK